MLFNCKTYCHAKLLCFSQRKNTKPNIQTRSPKSSPGFKIAAKLCHFYKKADCHFKRRLASSNKKKNKFQSWEFDTIQVPTCRLLMIKKKILPQVTETEKITWVTENK